jgi:hypothetical protein
MEQLTNGVALMFVKETNEAKYWRTSINLLSWCWKASTFPHYKFAAKLVLLELFQGNVGFNKHSNATMII